MCVNFITYSIQHISLNANTELGYAHKCNLHIIAISLLCLLARVTGVASILEYSEKVVSSRNDEASHLLPVLLDSKHNYEKKNLTVPHLMLDKVQLIFPLFFKTKVSLLSPFSARSCRMSAKCRHGTQSYPERCSI